MAVEVGEPGGFLHPRGGLLGTALFEGVGVRRQRLGQLLGQEDQLIDVGIGAHCSPCILSISSET